MTFMISVVTKEGKVFRMQAVLLDRRIEKVRQQKCQKEPTFQRAPYLVDKEHLTTVCDKDFSTVLMCMQKNGDYLRKA